MIQSLLLPTHKVAVIIFLLHYVIKTFLLLINKPEALKKYTAGTKVAEMIISVVFLITGVWLIAETGSPTTLQIIKFTLVALSIPIAIIGFKKGNKAMAVTALLFIIGAYGLAEVNKARKGKDAVTAEIKDETVVTDPAAAGYDLLKHGEALYDVKCKSCHGLKGNNHRIGSDGHSLNETQMDEAAIIATLRNGRVDKGMPIFNTNLLSDAEAKAVSAYVLTLKK